MLTITLPSSSLHILVLDDAQWLSSKFCRGPCCFWHVGVQEVQAMPAVLDTLTAGFALDLAALAAHRGMLQLEEWLASRIAALRLPFVQALSARFAAGLQPSLGCMFSGKSRSVIAALTCAHQKNVKQKRCAVRVEACRLGI